MKLFTIQRKDNTVPSLDCQLLVITEGVKTRGDECSPVGREMIARTPSAWPWKHGRDSLACMVTYGIIEKNESHQESVALCGDAQWKQLVNLKEQGVHRTNVETQEMAFCLCANRETIMVDTILCQALYI